MFSKEVLPTEGVLLAVLVLAFPLFYRLAPGVSWTLLAACVVQATWPAALPGKQILTFVPGGAPALLGALLGVWGLKIYAPDFLNVRFTIAIAILRAVGAAPRDTAPETPRPRLPSRVLKEERELLEELRSALPAEVTDPSQLQLFEEAGEYGRLLEELRKLVAKDREGTLTDPFVKDFLARRWRNIFIQEACKEPAAVKAATRDGWFSKDQRPVEQRIAERFLKGTGPLEWKSAVQGPEAEVVPMPPGSNESFSSADGGTFVFCPGLVNGFLPGRGFAPSMADEEKRSGGKFLRASSHPLRGCSENGQDILAALERGVGLKADTTAATEDPSWTPPRDVILMGYSKGMADIITFLVEHPEWRPRIRGVFGWAGAVMGSQVADGVWESVQGWDVETSVNKLTQLLDWLCPVINLKQGPLSRTEEMRPLDAVRDLTTQYRGDFFKKHRQELIDMKVPMFCITGATTVEEVPHFQAAGKLMLDMYDANNDMQLTTQNAQIDIPMGMHIAQLNANHWDMTYSKWPAGTCLGSNQLDHPFPKHAALKAMIMFSDELGLLGK